MTKMLEFLLIAGHFKHNILL